MKRSEDHVSVHDFTVDDDMVSCVSDIDDFHSCIGEEIAEERDFERVNLLGRVPDKNAVEGEAGDRSQHEQRRGNWPY